MKKKPPAKRKQPSLDSIYRRVLRFQTTLLNQMALIRLDIVTERQADRQETQALITSEVTLMRADMAAIYKRLETASLGQAHLRVTCRTLADHASRLLKEKETLQKQLAAPVTSPYHGRPDECYMREFHKPNSICACCDYMFNADGSREPYTGWWRV